MNTFASDDQVFVCGACGKLSNDRYGTKKISRGWDESCMMHAVLVHKASMVFDNSGLCVKADAVKKEDPK